MAWVLATVAGAALVLAFIAAVTLFCSTNSVVEGRELKIGSRFAESALTIGDPQLDLARQRHYRRCDSRASERRPGYLELCPAASRGRAA
jgi:hypothetical protein